MRSNAALSESSKSYTQETQYQRSPIFVTLHALFPEGFLRKLSGFLYSLLLLQVVGFVVKVVDFHSILDLQIIFKLLSLLFKDDRLLGLNSAVAFWFVAVFLFVLFIPLLILCFSGFFEAKKQAGFPFWLRCYSGVLYISLTILVIPFLNVLLSFVVCGVDSTQTLFVVQVVSPSQCHDPWEIARRLFALILVVVLVLSAVIRFQLLHTFSPLANDKFAVSSSYAHTVTLYSFLSFLFLLYAFPYRYWLIRTAFLAGSLNSWTAFYRYQPFYSKTTTLKSGLFMGFWVGSALAFLIHSIFSISNGHVNLILFLSMMVPIGLISGFIFKRQYICRALVISSCDSIGSQEFDSLMRQISSVRQVDHLFRALLPKPLLSKYQTIFDGLLAELTPIFEDSVSFLIFMAMYHTYVTQQFLPAKNMLNSVMNHDSDKSIFQKWMIFNLSQKVESLKRASGSHHMITDAHYHNKSKLMSNIDSSYHNCLSVIASFWNALLQKNVDLSKVCKILNDLHSSKEMTVKHFSQFFDAGYDDYPIVQRFSWYMREVERDDDTADYLETIATSLIAGKESLSGSGSNNGSIMTGTSINKSVLSIRSRNKQKIRSATFQKSKSKSFLHFLVTFFLIAFVLLQVLTVSSAVLQFNHWQVDLNLILEMSHVTQSTFQLPVSIIQSKLAEMFNISTFFSDAADVLVAEAEHLSFHLNRLATGSTLAQSSCPSSLPLPYSSSL
ncbi:hypothetical protein GEMRC1_006050 [Eukaryota sp. GEM-RC1]